MSQRIADFVSKIALPAGITIALAQSALYDVPGGKRAVIFDRLKGSNRELLAKVPTFGAMVTKGSDI